MFPKIQTKDSFVTLKLPKKNMQECKYDIYQVHAMLLTLWPSSPNEDIRQHNNNSFPQLSHRGAFIFSSAGLYLLEGLG